jgi:hypothetical protein
MISANTLLFTRLQVALLSIQVFGLMVDKDVKDSSSRTCLFLPLCIIICVNVSCNF